jgi:kynureninase
MDELLEWRKEFPSLENTVYFISHSLGAMPRQTRERLNQYADMWTERSIRAWDEGWWEMPRSVGNLVGKIIGADKNSVVMHQNVSICQSMILSCLDFSGRRNKIVSESMNFSSNLYIYHAMEKQGARFVTVPTEDGMTIPIEKMLEAIDEETLLVSVSHVLFRSSFIQDLKALADRAHEVGALIVADIYQAAGTVPLNVKELNLDFATGGSVKWLCGGPGAGYLYVRPDLWERLEPRATGWLAHKHPFDFVVGPTEYADDIYRFLNGSPNVPGMYAAMSGYEIINQIGVENIRAKSIRQTTKLIELAEEAGFTINCPRNSAVRGGTVVVDVPNGQQVTKELLRRDFLVDFRPGAGIRMAPHFYTKDEELELIVREIKTILETRAYEQHSAVAH